MANKEKAVAVWCRRKRRNSITDSLFSIKSG